MCNLKAGLLARVLFILILLGLILVMTGYSPF
jgi:hypothetical protein